MPCRRPGPGLGAWQRAVGFAGGPGGVPAAQRWPLVVAAGAERLMGSLGSLPQPPPLHRRGCSPASQLAQFVHRRRWTWSKGLCHGFVVGTGHQRSQPHPDAALPLPQPCATAVPGTPRHWQQREGVGAAGGWRQLVTGVLQPGGSPPAGHRPGRRAGRAGTASRAEAWGRRGGHGLSIPPAVLQGCRALACRDDGADDALGLRRKAEKSCHGDRLCHFKEAPRHSHPSLPDEPRQREARGAGWG